MTNICFFTHNLALPGETERISIALANALAKLPGFWVSMLSLEPFDSTFFPVEKNVAAAFLNIDGGDNIPKNYFKAVKQLRRYLKENKIDIIVDVDVLLSAISLPASARIKTRVISWEHGNYAKTKNGVRRIARKMAARYSKAVVTRTEQEVRFYKEKCKAKTEITVIPDFVEKMPSGFYFGSHKNILSGGHSESSKGLDLLLDIWSKIDSNLKEGWKLRIIGEEEDREKREKQIRTNPLNDSVELLPPAHNKEEYYKKAAVYAMTSKEANFPITLIEAKLHGIPTIAFDCPTGPREIIRNETDGFLIPCFETDNYVQALSKLMQDRSLRRKLSQNAIQDRERFSPENAVQKWVELIKRAKK